MLGTADRKIRDFLIALCQRGGVINSTTAIAAAKVLIQSSSDPNLKRIPDKARKDNQLVFMHKIIQKVEKHNIPHSLIISADQTPSKYVPVG